MMEILVFAIVSVLLGLIRVLCQIWSKDEKASVLVCSNNKADTVKLRSTTLSAVLPAEMDAVDTPLLSKIPVSTEPGTIPPVQLLVSDQLVLTKVETSVPDQKIEAEEAEWAASRTASEKAPRNQVVIGFI